MQTGFVAWPLYIIVCSIGIVLPMSLEHFFVLQYDWVSLSLSLFLLNIGLPVEER